MNCPYCLCDNIPGTDLCEACGADLAGLDLPEAARGFAGRLMTDRVGDLKLAPPLTVSPSSPVAEAIDLMRQRRHGCVLVVDGWRLAGIFTERDVLERVVVAGLDPEATPVSDVMTPEPIALDPGDPPAFAIHLTVARGLRHLPIVDRGTLRGFISVRNLLRYVREDVIGAEA